MKQTGINSNIIKIGLPARSGWLLLLFMTCMGFRAVGQVDLTKEKTLVSEGLDSLKDQSMLALPDSLLPDSLRALIVSGNSDIVDSLRALGFSVNSALDSNQVDSNRIARNNPLNRIDISDDALDDEVIYSARDTTIYDLTNETVYLYGGAKVEYTDINLEADKIIFNWATNEVIAEGLKDTITGQTTGYPVFKDKNQSFEAKFMRYNVKSRKGIVKNVITKQGSDLYVVGEKAKFSSVEDDSLGVQTVVYSEDAIFTTCDHPEPHFGVRSKKQKVVPNKVVIVGPSNLEIMGVPTPLWLPFGFYPITDQGSTGLIFPKDYENSDLLGFGIKGIGWYFPINDYVNLELTADYYLRGTWGVTGRSTYKRKYKFGGNLRMSYSEIQGEDAFASKTTSKAMQISWSHSQDAKANPIHSFSSSVNIATNNYIGQRETSAQLTQTNRLNSSITYSRKFPGKKWGFTASFNHNQNRSDSTFNFTFPNLLFTTGNFQLFKSKGGKKKWYENFNFSYRAQAESRFSTKDNEIFTQKTLDSTNPGMKQEVTGSFNAKLFKFFNFSVSSSFSENWYVKTTNKIFDPTLTIDSSYNMLDGDSILVVDTTAYGQVVESSDYGFKAFHNLKSTSMSLSTKIFSTTLLKKGKLRGLRHVLTPSFGFSYNPDQTSFFENSVDTDTRDDFNNPREYSIFEDVIYDKPSNQEERINFTYGFGNTLEAKIYSRKAKETKNIKIIESLTINGNRNFRADSLQWSDPSLSARTTLFKKLMSVQFNSTFSFYEKNSETNQKINKYLVKEGKGLLRTERSSLTVRTGISVKQFFELVRGEENEVTPDEGTLESLINNFRIKHNLVMSWTTPNNRDTFNISTNTIDLNGGLKISENWDVKISRIGYDFVKKSIVYPDFTFTRNLHCWQMSVTWRPVANTFFFSLGVRPGTLDVIKVPYKRNAQDGRRG